MLIDEDTMQQIAWNVFQEMLGLSCSSTDNTLPSDRPRLAALICIFGRTKESLVVETSPETARIIASTMFGAAAESLSETEVNDAAGEIANMIGGNMKGMFEGESRLSMPCVSLDEPTEPCDDEQRTWVQVAGHPILIRWRQLDGVPARV
ncbi:MAG: hypothetical protein Fues2KO_41150 [Fuerstiella sp.]